MDRGCRKISDEFNRKFESTKNMTVSKSYVANLIRDNLYNIQVAHNNIKHRPPKPIPKQHVWGIDLTFKTDSQKQTHPIFDIIEHHSRKNLTLEALKDKSSITLLRTLFVAIERYGKPKIIRTDNEAVFTSTLFVLSLKLLGIRHQRIDKHCPWQNGRVERFFGTLKQKLNLVSISSIESLNQNLHTFQFWYNLVRTHNNLNGKTPDEVWYGIQVKQYGYNNAYYFNDWDGVVDGVLSPGVKRPVSSNSEVD